MKPAGAETVNCLRSFIISICICYYSQWNTHVKPNFMYVAVNLLLTYRMREMINFLKFILMQFHCMWQKWSIQMHSRADSTISDFLSQQTQSGDTHKFYFV